MKLARNVGRNAQARAWEGGISVFACLAHGHMGRKIPQYDGRFVGIRTNQMLDPPLELSYDQSLSSPKLIGRLGWMR